jgi:hypothetical protein
VERCALRAPRSGRMSHFSPETPFGPETVQSRHFLAAIARLFNIAYVTGEAIEHSLNWYCAMEIRCIAKPACTTSEGIDARNDW